MPLIDYVSPDDLPAELRDLIEYDYASADSKLSLFYAVLANNPDMLRVRSEYAEGLRFGGDLPPEVKELIHVVVSQTNECEYCASSHGENLVEVHGAPRDRLDEIALDDLDGFTEKEQAVIRFARQVATDPKRVSADHVEDLHTVGFSDADVIEILTFATYAIASNTFVDAMNIHPADRDQTLPSYYPANQ